MIYRARTLVAMAGAPVEDGAVAVAADRIIDAGSFAEVHARHAGEVTDLGEVVLLPGLINAHCHLDFTKLRGMIRPQDSFADWIRQINRLRRKMSAADFLASIAEGFVEARRWGTTTIANIESMPGLLAQMAPPPLRTWWFLELIDVGAILSPEAQLARVLACAAPARAWPGGLGLSPHAPYTTSPTLSRAAATTGLPLAMHLAESREEMEMFRDGRGALFDLLQNLGRPMDDCGKGQTPLALMLDRQPLDERWIVAHLNELGEEDFARLEGGRRFQIAHCPRSSRYFRHTPFALQRLRRLGFNIALGTDSLASNSSLSLFSEMQAVRDAHPWLAAREILEMATLNGARALQQEKTLGQIAPGFAADMIALPLASNGGGDLFEKIIAWDEPVEWMLVNGLPVTPF